MTEEEHAVLSVFERSGLTYADRLEEEGWVGVLFTRVGALRELVNE
jgi:hypothetical protein